MDNRLYKQFVGRLKRKKPTFVEFLVDKFELSMESATLIDNACVQFSSSEDVQNTRAVMANIFCRNRVTTDDVVQLAERAPGLLIAVAHLRHLAFHGVVSSAKFVLFLRSIDHKDKIIMAAELEKLSSNKDKQE